MWVPGISLPGGLGSLIGCISHGCVGSLPGVSQHHLALVVLALGLHAHDQDLFAGAEQVGVLRRFVAAAVADQVLFPGPG